MPQQANETIAERTLRMALERAVFDNRIRGPVMVQYPLLANNDLFYLDFAVIAYNVAIQVDGLETQGAYDVIQKEKKAFESLGSSGWKTMRFTDVEVMSRTEEVVGAIVDACLARSAKDN